MALPNFVIAGTVRGATTSLHYYLEQHPAIAMSSLKEPNFFLFDNGKPLVADSRIISKSVRDRRGYEALFDHGADLPRRGEASPLYLYTREVPGLIATELDDARVVAIVREPVARAWSHFLHLYRGEPKAAAERFREAITPELAKRDVYEPYLAGTHYLRIGRYADQVERYHEVFGGEHVHVVDYDAVQRDAASVLRGVCTFLAVDPDFAFDVGTVYNQSGVVRSNLVGRARMAVNRVQPYAKRLLPTGLVRRAAHARARFEHRTLDKPAPLEADFVAELRDWFADDVSRLARLLALDLSHWHTAAAA